MEYLDAGASHVIVTSFVFREGRLEEDRLKDLVGHRWHWAGPIPSKKVTVMKAYGTQLVQTLPAES